MSAREQPVTTVWRTGALGDFVLTLPVLRAARQASRVLTVVAPRRYKALFDAADRWIDSDGPHATRLISGRVSLPSDLAVCWGEIPAAALRSAGAGTVLQGSPHPPDGVHQCDNLWSPVEPWLGARTVGPKIRPTRGLETWTDHVVIAPGSGGTRKRWGLDEWRTVAARLDPVVWVAGPQEQQEAGWGSPRLDGLDLGGLVALASVCRAWVGPDAGPQHLAAAVGAPVGVVFNGQTDPRCWAPVGATVLRPDPAAVTAFLIRVAAERPLP